MRLFRKNIPQSLCALCALALAAVLSGCSLFGTKTPPPANPDPKADPGSNVVFRVGDKIKIELAGIPDPPQPIEQDVKDDGSISLAYIERVIAAGKTPKQLEIEIHDAYVPKWYKHVSVTVTPGARFFYVGGEVGSPGRILYSGPITLMGAIDAAVGFTPFANKRNVQITRVNGAIEHVDCKKLLKHPERDVPIYPGDKIQVNKRF